MELHDERIPDDRFAEFIAHMPQICVEIVVEQNKRVLLAKRVNEPAQDEWFWPGGRLMKGEELEEAAHRIASEELGIDIEIHGQLGTYSHFWETSAEQGHPSRHTVNIVYHVIPANDSPAITLDEQHSEIRWITEIEDEFHDYVKTYLEKSNLV